MRRENTQLSVSREKVVPYVQEKKSWQESLHFSFPETTEPPPFPFSFTCSKLMELAHELGKKGGASPLPLASWFWEPPEGQREMEAIFVSLWWRGSGMFSALV